MVLVKGRIDRDMQDGQMECLTVVMSKRMIEACLTHQMLPPLIVPDGAHHVREFLLYDYEDDTLVAYARSSGWGWHCVQSLVRTATIEEVDELVDQEVMVQQTTIVADKLEEKGLNLKDSFPLINVLAIYHLYTHTCDPTREEIIEHSAAKRIDLMNDPLFEKSVKKLQSEPICRAFFLLHNTDPDSVDLLLKMRA